MVPNNTVEGSKQPNNQARNNNVSLENHLNTKEECDNALADSSVGLPPDLDIYLERLY